MWRRLDGPVLDVSLQLLERPPRHLARLPLAPIDQRLDVLLGLRETRERPGSAQGNPDARVDPFNLILQARPPRGIEAPLEGARVVHGYRLPVPCRVAEGVCRNLVDA